MLTRTTERGRGLGLWPRRQFIARRLVPTGWGPPSADQMGMPSTRTSPGVALRVLPPRGRLRPSRPGPILPDHRVTGVGLTGYLGDPTAGLLIGPPLRLTCRRLVRPGDRRGEIVVTCLTSLRPPGTARAGRQTRYGGPRRRSERPGKGESPRSGLAVWKKPPDGWTPGPFPHRWPRPACRSGRDLSFSRG